MRPTTCLALVVTPFLAALSGPAPPAFSDPIPFESPFTARPSGVTFPGCMVDGDFDGDGIRDIAIGGSGVVVLKGLGNAGFVPQDTISSVLANFLAAGDLDADTDLDLVHSYAGLTGVHLNLGNGTFAPPVYYGSSVPGVGSPCAIGDLSGDGVPDLLVGLGADLEFHAGLGGGVFAPPILLPAASGLMDGITVADLDGDLDLDIVASRGTVVTVWIQQSPGVIASPTAYITGNYGPPVVANLDDGPGTDIVFGGGFLPGNGNGTFGPAVIVGGAPQFGARVGDMDQDGRPDLLTVPPDETRFLLYRNLGGGSFDEPTSHPAPYSPQSFTVGDFDGDSILDAVGASNTGYYSLHIGNGDGTFGRNRHFPGGPVPSFDRDGIAVADLNGDGLLDVLELSDATVSLLPGDGAGGLLPPIAFATPGSRSISIGDLNDDDVPDFVTSNDAGISVFLGAGSGAFAPRVDYASPGTCYQVVIADLNSDGRGDVVVTNTASVSTFLANPDGSLGPRTDYGGTNPVYRVAVGLLDADAYPDVVVLRWTDTFGTMWVRFGSATGALGALQPPISIISPYDANIGDVNGDGFNDLVVSGGNGGSQTTVHLGAGDGTFASAVPLSTRRGSDATLADLDGDLDLDLIVAKSYATGAGIYLNDGSGAFTLDRIYGADGPGLGVAVGDLNQDGRPDLAVRNLSANAVSVLLAAGANVSVDAGARPNALRLARVWPTPSRGPLQVAFATPSRMAIAAEVFDVAGRRVLRRDFGTVEPGLHHRELRLPSDSRNGLYWIRLSGGPESASGRLTLLR